VKQVGFHPAEALGAVADERMPKLAGAKAVEFSDGVASSLRSISGVM